MLDIFLFYATQVCVCVCVCVHFPYPPASLPSPPPSPSHHPQSLADTSVSIRVSGLDIIAAISKMRPDLILPLVSKFEVLCEAWQVTCDV